ncbi:MAG: hypothetical protein J6Z01_15140 [Bacteroidales bacterium]|nr:hypothetical protein [Bacteroidales bacterium]
MANITVPRAPTKFEAVTQIVIDNLEGGYYHPNMKVREPKKFAVMKDSGETMYGIDRKAGGDINTTEAGKAFWAIIDGQNAANTWTYQYKATGEVAKNLKMLAAKMIYDVYVKLCNLYGIDRSIVDNDECLLVHWCYACWNGSKHFRNYAKIFNAELNRQKKKGGKYDYDLLRAAALYARQTDYVKDIRDRAYRISDIWKKYYKYTLPEKALKQIKEGNKSYLLWILGGVLLVGGGVGFYIYKKRKKQ